MSDSGSWRYVVLVGAFLVNFMNTGTAKCVGVLIPQLRKSFDTDVSQIGFAIGMCHGLAVALAFLARPLLNVTSCRVLTMIGGCLAGLGFSGCSISVNTAQFTAGVALGGLGYSLMIISNVVIVRAYFPECFGTAASVTFTGGAVGMMVVPVITERFESFYGWRGALLLIGALNFQTVTAGALYRPLTGPAASDSDDDGVTSMFDAVEAAPRDIKRQPLHGKQCTAMNGAHGCSGNCNTQRPSSRSDVTVPLNTLSKNDTITNKRRKGHRMTDAAVTGASNPSSSRESGFNDETSSLQRYTEESTLLINEDCTNKNGRKIRRKVDATTHCYAVVDTVLSIFDAKLVCDYPAMLLVMITALLSGVTTTGWIAFLVPNGIQKGYPVEKAVILATIGGFGNMFGRFFIGNVTGDDRCTGRCRGVSSRVAFIASSVLSAVAFALNPVSCNFGVLSILSMINGTTVGSRTVLICLMLEEIIDPLRFVSGVSSIYVFLGIGEIVGGLFGGWLFDITQSFDVPFVVFGVVDFVAALLTALTLCCCLRNSTSNQIDDAKS